jgi:hypothetical protein
MDVQEFMQEFETEARRLRLNMLRHTGLAGTGSEWLAPLLERMRALEPGATWEDVFPGRQVPEPDPLLADAITAMDRDPDAYWRERALYQELGKELERVVRMPVVASESNALGIGWSSFPHGPEHALRVLRRLPDQAGGQAFHEALESTPSDE